MRWATGTMVAFEGLDNTGKSTQFAKLRGLHWEQPPAVAHMPSGADESTADIYRITEARKTQSPLGVQLLHLAAHSFNMPLLIQARNQRGLLLDRCGWSPLAYGRLGAGMDEAGVSAELFVQLAEAIWSRLIPDVIFLFDQPYAADVANMRSVEAAYRLLADAAGTRCVRVLPGSVEQIHSEIMSSLRERGIIR